jgi:hypothetical protein
MATTPITLDMTKSQPLNQPVTLDMSKSQPLEQPVQQPPEKPGLMEKLSNISDDLATGVSKEAVASAGGLQTLVSEGLNKIPYVGETLAPRAGIEAEKRSLAEGTKLEGVAQHVGAGAEQVGEWMLGDAALKGLSKLGVVAKHAPELLELAEKFPATAKLLLGAGKGAVIGGAQAGVKAEAEGKDVGAAVKSGAAGGAIGGAAGEGLAMGVEASLEKKIARSMINKSLGAGARDVAYGNPAKALLDENITSPFTGDIEVYKTALRTGKTPEEAAQVAGGRIAAINSKINELKPQLDSVLQGSKAKIPLFDIMGDTVLKTGVEIENDPALTAAEKRLAGRKLDGLYDSIKEWAGKENITPVQAAELKRSIGNRIAWGGKEAVGDNVKPVYKELYGALKNAVHTAVPEAAQLDERLTNLMAAYGDVVPLAGKEEVGAGTGVMGGNIWDVFKRLQAEVGRFVPGIRSAARAAGPTVKSAIGLTGEKIGTSGLPPVGEGMVRFRSSVGGIHDVPQESLDQAKGIDPGLQVIQ